MATVLTNEQIKEDEREATFEDCGYDPKTIDGRGEVEDANN